MSAKLFNAIVGGMTTDNLHDFDVMKRVGKEFGNVFSDKDFKGKDSSYPYSKQYFLDMRKDALGKLEDAWTDTVDKMSLGGSSGSDAVRQARINAGNMAEKPNKVKIENDNEN